MALKGASSSVISGTPAALAAERIAQELLDSYRVCVRYSLSWANRLHFIQHNKKLSISAASAADAKRKKVSPLHREINSIAKVKATIMLFISLI
jgi:hypothetical protein